MTREQYKELKRKGKCIACRRRKANAGVRCKQCADKNRDQQRQYWAYARGNGTSIESKQRIEAMFALVRRLDELKQRIA